MCGLGVSLLPANEVWGKVIFLHLSVILFTGGGGLQPGGLCRPPSKHHRMRSTSGRYASCWNTFLFNFVATENQIKSNIYKTKKCAYQNILKWMFKSTTELNLYSTEHSATQQKIESLLEEYPLLSKMSVFQSQINI